jgi:hypothetical protein
MSTEVVSLADRLNLRLISPALADALDERDDLKEFREEFAMPKCPHDKSREAIYLCGNSLGPMPLKSAQYVQEELDNWRLQGSALIPRFIFRFRLFRIPVADS